MPHLTYIVFLFALGACVGSFLNVVVWRLPKVEQVEGESLIRGYFRSLHALSEPPSHCPNCNKLLKWYDNIPVFGWIKLGGKCRFCRVRFSIRYPVVEFITGAMFVGYYVAFFMLQIGPCVQRPDGTFHHRHLYLVEHWWVYGLDMVLLSALLAASLIDAELFIIPIEIPWSIVPVALVAHAWLDRNQAAGSVMVSPLPGALAAGATLGTILSIVLVNFNLLPRSFAEGDPLLEVERDALESERKTAAGKAGKGSAKVGGSGVPEPGLSVEEREWSPGEIRREIRREMLFLMPALLLGIAFVLLAWKVEPVGRWWASIASYHSVSAVLGSLLGGLVGGFTVWITRILGSYGFGRQAMGMGDVDLMVGVGAVLGAGPAVVAFFLAPFFGIAVAMYMWLIRQKRELPYGPYLSLATAFVMLYYCPIARYFTPGLANLGWLIHNAIAGNG